MRCRSSVSARTKCDLQSQDDQQRPKRAVHSPPDPSAESLAQSGVAAGTAGANRPRTNAIPSGLVISVRKPPRKPRSKDGLPRPVPAAETVVPRLVV
jgi:hypothetical protein